MAEESDDLVDRLAALIKQLRAIPGVNARVNITIDVTAPRKQVEYDARKHQSYY